MPLQSLSASLRALAAALVVSSAALAASPDARAEPPAAAEIADVRALPVNVLERAFWICDHRATTHGVDATPVEACTAVFDALKEAKFGGDFGELLAWWRQNKLIEHTRLESN